jgi:WD40 repeat protein
MTIFPGTTRIAVGYMGNEECTEIRVWDAVGQGQIASGGGGGGAEGGKVVEVPPLWSVPGHDDTIVSVGVIGGDGLVSSGYDRTVRFVVQGKGGREGGEGLGG